MSSVKVAVRVRPFNNREIQKNCKIAIEIREQQTIITGGPKVPCLPILLIFFGFWISTLLLALALSSSSF